MEYQGSFYTVTLRQARLVIELVMHLSLPIVNTGDLPRTFALLKERLPTLLLQTCYNEAHLPFHREVKQTEIGHLFEHILLEYLCIFTLEAGANQAVFSGRTNWNWLDDPKGTFYISIESEKLDPWLLHQALQATISLTDELLLTATKDPFLTEEILLTSARQ